MREPSNPHDPRALRIEIAGEHVGYVPRGVCVKPSADVRVIKIGLAPMPHVWVAVIEATRKPLTPVCFKTRMERLQKRQTAARALLELLRGAQEFLEPH